MTRIDQEEVGAIMWGTSPADLVRCRRPLLLLHCWSLLSPSATAALPVASSSPSRGTKEEEAFPSMAPRCSSGNGALDLSHRSKAGAMPATCWHKP